MSKLEKIVSRCNGIVSWRGRGAKPPEFEGVENPKHCPKWYQTDLLNIQTLSRESAFLNLLADCIGGAQDDGRVSLWKIFQKIDISQNGPQMAYRPLGRAYGLI